MSEQTQDWHPTTLGDYRLIAFLVGGANCKAVKFLDEKIAEQGAGEIVIAAESQMMILIGSMLGEE